MARLVVCPYCNIHVKQVEPRCPHCDAALPIDKSTLGATAGALLLGLALGGCTSTEPPPKPQKQTIDVKKAEPVHEPEAEYGVPMHDEEIDPPAPAYGVAEPLPQPDAKQPDAKQPDAKQPDAKQPG